MKVSIIIPAKNSGRYLRHTLRSVAAQTYRNHEVILVDDYSQDNTSEIVEEFRGHLDLRWLKPASELKSAAASRNWGYEHSTGEWIKFLDSDDLLSQDQLELQVNALLSLEPTALSVSRWGRFYAEFPESGDRLVGEIGSFDPFEWLLESMRQGHRMLQCGMFLLPRTLLAKSGLWNPAPSPCDDFEFYSRVLMHASRVIAVPGVLWYRSGLSNSLSKQIRGQFASNAAESISLGLGYFLARENSDRVREQCGKIYADWAWNLFPGDKRAARHLEECAIRCGCRRFIQNHRGIVHQMGRLMGWRTVKLIQMAYRRGRSFRGRESSWGSVTSLGNAGKSHPI